MSAVSLAQWDSTGDIAHQQRKQDWCFNPLSSAFFKMREHGDRNYKNMEELCEVLKSGKTPKKLRILILFIDWW